MVAVVVAKAYVEIQVPAMVAVAATDWMQFAFELDEVAVMMNEEKVEECLEVVKIVEEKPELLGVLDVL